MNSPEFWNHPQHHNFVMGPGNSITFDNFMGACLNPVARPVRASWGLLRWRIERRCRKSGGHYWHHDDAGQFCCNCGAERNKEEK